MMTSMAEDVARGSCSEIGLNQSNTTAWVSHSHSKSVPLIQERNYLDWWPHNDVRNYRRLHSLCIDYVSSWVVCYARQDRDQYTTSQCSQGYPYYPHTCADFEYVQNATGQSCLPMLHPFKSMECKCLNH